MVGPLRLQNDCRHRFDTNLKLSDDSSASITSPFPIMFGGHPFTTLFVSSNGQVTFSTPFLRDAINEPLATPRIDTLVAPLWDNLVANPDAGAGHTRSGR